MQQEVHGLRVFGKTKGFPLFSETFELRTFDGMRRFSLFQAFGKPEIVSCAFSIQVAHLRRMAAF